MNNGRYSNQYLMSKKERQKANRFLVNYLQRTMDQGHDELQRLHRNLSVTYWVVVALSIVMFAVGIILLSVPVVAALDGRITELQSMIAAGFGIADLAALFLFRPLERIHHMMGDMSQITLALNSYQTQVGLRLQQMDAEARQSIGRAANHVGEAANDTISLVQAYFEG